MDALTYCAQRERECAQCSAAPVDVSIIEEDSSADPPLAKLIGRAQLGENAFVSMYEIVELHDDHVHRIKYGYYLFVDGDEIGGYDRDPIHGPGEHRHCTHRDDGHRPGGEPAPAVSFKEAVGFAWEWLAANGAP